MTKKAIIAKIQKEEVKLYNDLIWWEKNIGSEGSVHDHKLTKWVNIVSLMEKLGIDTQQVMDIKKAEKLLNKAK